MLGRTGKSLRMGRERVSNRFFPLPRSLRFSAFVFLLAAAMIAPAAAAASEGDYVVSTTAGQVRGLPRSGGGAQFHGIPYAEPPVGNLRWRAPIPAKPWTGIRDADVYGAPCVQPDLGGWNRYDAEHGREDCLYLNVNVPAWPVKKPLPVMFWIHGGANEGGSGSGGLYNDGTLADHGVVVVTINYRLGLFGFLAHPALSAESAHHASGDYGLMDQILALKWVCANIARFGGDARNITVFGQSAGAMDTGMLMTSPLARGLFQKAIAESGTPFAPPLATLAAAEQQGVKLAARIDPGATSPSSATAIAALRAIPAQELLAKAGPVVREWPGVGPDIDHWVIPHAPARVFASGREAAIPLLIGTTTREFGSALAVEPLRAAIEQAAGALAPEALALYGLANDGQGDADHKYGSAAEQWAADSVFRCPTVAEAAWHTAAGHAVYQYELDHAIPGQPFAVHSAELPYVLGYFPKTGNISGSFGRVDFELARLIQTYWTNFARTGNPNSAPLPEWKPFGKRQNYIQFLENGAVAPAQGLRRKQAKLYREALEARWKAAH